LKDKRRRRPTIKQKDKHPAVLKKKCLLNGLITKLETSETETSGPKPKTGRKRKTRSPDNVTPGAEGLGKEVK